MNKQALLFYPLLGVVLLGLFVGRAGVWGRTDSFGSRDGYFAGEGI